MVLMVPIEIVEEFFNFNDQSISEKYDILA